MQLSRLIERWGAPQGGPALDPGQELGPVCTDSRQLGPGSLFVPLVGERFDGHTFLAEAARLGAQAALVQRDRAQSIPAGLAYWLVDDTLAAYQALGLLWRRQLAAPVLAVTGSAGKTTTRELLRAVLATTGPVWASQGNENNDIGVPLTLLQATGEHRAVVVEMGMRGLGEIERLSRCCEPDLAVITNVGTAHIGRLGSRGAIAQAKCEITAALKPDGLVVIPAGDPLLDRSLAAVWGGRVLRVALAGEGLEAQADWVGQWRGFTTPATGCWPWPQQPAWASPGIASSPWSWPCPGAAVAGCALAPSSCWMRPTTPPRRRPWRPSPCWPGLLRVPPVLRRLARGLLGPSPRRDGGLRCSAPCSSSVSKAWICIARSPSGPWPWGSMAW